MSTLKENVEALAKEDGGLMRPEQAVDETPAKPLINDGVPSIFAMVEAIQALQRRVLELERKLDRK